MYQLKSKVRYSEANSKERLTYSALLNYFQDSSTLHSETLGASGQSLYENHMAWILSFWQICIEEMPSLSEDVVVSTWPYDTKGLFGMRNFCMESAEGKKLAVANSIWVIMKMSVADMTRIYDNLDVHFESWLGESDADPYIPAMVEDIKAKGLAVMSEGAWVVPVAEETDKKEKCKP